MRIAFLATPDFALPSLDMLVRAGHELCVFTQPDRPVGRRGTLTPPAVKTAALARGIPVRQFERIKSPEGVAALSEFAPELMVTAAFGQLLSKEDLEIPKYGCINVHGSLLPKYRGAAPIQWAVINGEKTTGVTTMMTELGLDTGDILMSEETAIGPEETAGGLFDRLALIGAGVLSKTINALEAGTLTRTKQDERLATKCTVIKKEDGHIDFSKSAQSIHDLVRGMDPWPSAYAAINGENVKIWKTRVAGEACGAGGAGACVAANRRDGLLVNAGDGLLEICELQFPGGKRMDAGTALLGHAIEGKRFG